MPLDIFGYVWKYLVPIIAYNCRYMHILADHCRPARSNFGSSDIKRVLKTLETSPYRNHPHSSTIFGMDGPSMPVTVRSSGAAFAPKDKPVLTDTAKREGLLFVDQGGAILVPVYADELRYLQKDSKGAIVVPDVFDDPVEEQNISTKKISIKKVPLGKREKDTHRFDPNRHRKRCPICGKKPGFFLTCHLCQRKVCCAQTSCSSRRTMACSECDAVAKGSS